MAERGLVSFVRSPAVPGVDDAGQQLDDSVEHELLDWSGGVARWPGGAMETTVVLPCLDVPWRRRWATGGRL
jgi:hypothetical protein